MKDMLIKCALLLMLVTPGLRAEGAADTAAAGTAAAPQVAVSVDPRVELMSIIFRLADRREYNMGRLPGYVRDVDAQFGPFRDHPAVKYAAELRRSSIGYDAPMSLAVHLKDATGLEQRLPFAARPGGLCPRWDPAEAAKMADLARDFAKASGFNDFYAKHQPLYDTAVQRMQALLKSEIRMEWFGEFFGPGKRADFRIVLGMLNGGNNYGPHFVNADGSEEVYSVLGVWQADKDGQAVFAASIVPTIVHEFTHSYANPVVDQYAKELQGPGEKLYKEVADVMGTQAYGNWRTVMYESLVRACVHRYLLDNKGPAAMAKEAAQDLRSGFYWVDGLTELLGLYEAQPRKYKDVAEFFPQVVDFYKGYAPTVRAVIKAAKAKAAEEQAQKEKVMQAWREKGPHIVAMEPANGADSVAADLNKLVITFDQAMLPGWSFLQLEPGNYPAEAGQPFYDGDKKVITLPVKLQPGRTYVIGLNNADYTSFKNSGGTPLYPVVYKFSTKNR